MIKRMSNDAPEFYGYMGRVFGSRKVQKETADRFYDDDEKDWIVGIEENAVASVVSIKDSCIKNVYVEDVLSLICVLKEVFAEVSGGTVPIAYRNAYIEAGYEILQEKKNFLIIKGGKSKDE